jgi:UDP-glucose 4-epimerase
MSKVFVTGAKGFISRQLLARLKGQNTRLKVLSRTLHPEYETVVCDLASEVIPEDALNGVDTVFHLAGYAHDLLDSSRLERVHRLINVDATLHLAQRAVQSGVQQFVFVSSVKAGGSTLVAGHCMTEVDQGEPEGIYGKTKREAEIKLLEIGRHSGMHVSIVRPSLVYGPGVKGNLRLMLAGIKRGWFPPLPEVNNRRSMIHVDDLVQALMLEAEDDRANGEIYIATDGEPYSSRQIYEAICAVLGKPVPRWSVPKVIFDIVSRMNTSLHKKVNKLLGDECYSSKKLQSLGFKAQRSLKEMNETAF